MSGYPSSWNDRVAKSGILEFARPVTEAKRGSCCRLIGLRRLTTTGHCGGRRRRTSGPIFWPCAGAVSMRDNFKVVFDL